MFLIVDDQKDSGTVLVRLLRNAGHEAAAVTSGAEALAMLHICKPSLMILDVNMPDMDGMTVLRTMKEDNDLKDVQVLMYSAGTELETKAEAKRLGAVDFFTKGSSSFESLITRICDFASQPLKSIPFVAF